jgi:uncharacterized protein (TIGR04168 family)
MLAVVVAEERARIAVVGDLHSAWQPFDVHHFNQSDYALVLVTGDLGGSARRDGLQIARSLARLEKRTLIIPGNADAHEYAKLSAEFSYQRGRAGLMDALRPNEGRGSVEIAGYGLHALELGAQSVTLISARPFSKGGSELSSPELLEQSFGVRSLAESSERLRALVDRASTDALVFLAHNGPTGLGDHAAAPWGRDFDPRAGDWGDSDLADAVAHASARGRRAIAVVAGHMHWRLRGGGQRGWKVERDGVVFVNAACVPRIFTDGGDAVHHHIELSLGAEGFTAAEVLVRRP